MAIFDRAFPTWLDEIGRERESDWVIVASNPHHVRYFDEDAQAIDETNWDAMIRGLDGEREADSWEEHGDTFRILAADGMGADWGVWDMRDFPLGDDRHSPQTAYSWFDTVLAVRKDSPAYEHWEECSRAIADYPILDEHAYSVREFDAWDRCLSDYVIRDVAKDVAESLASDWGLDWEAQDDLSDAIETHWDEWTETMHNAMSSFNGFTGEYDHESAVDAVADWATGLELALKLWVRCGFLNARRAAGEGPLPGMTDYAANR